MRQPSSVKGRGFLSQTSPLPSTRVSPLPWIICDTAASSAPKLYHPAARPRAVITAPTGMVGGPGCVWLPQVASRQRVRRHDAAHVLSVEG